VGQSYLALRETIFEAGGDPDEPRVDVLPRNKQIFRAWKDGRSVKVLAKEYKLSDQSIRAICRRIDKILETKKFRFEEYKDLLP
jgi:DNA-binding NarL/FixJ family response regulator